MEFFQTGMGRKFFDHDVPELTETLNAVRNEMHRANNLKTSENLLKDKELSMKADELQMKERELRLKERELELMAQMMHRKAI